MDCERVSLLADTDSQVKPVRKWGNTDGLVAWLVAFSLFLINAVVLGQGRVASIFYVDFMQEFQINRMLASAPYSVQESTRMLFSPMAGMLGQKIGISSVAVLGCVVTALSCATCYFTHDFEWIILMWGGIYGLGAACVSTISMIVIEQYFTKHRSSAMCLAFSGTCVGALFFPALVDLLVEKYEIRGAFLIMGSIILHAIPIAMLVGKRSIVQDEMEIKSGKRHRIKPNYNSLPNKEGNMESSLESSGYSVNSNYISLTDKEGSMEGGLEGSGYSDKSETSKVTSTKIVKESPISSVMKHLSNKADFDPLNVSTDTKQENILEENITENVSSSPNLRIANNESKNNGQKDFETKHDNDSFSDISGSLLIVEKPVEIKSIDSILKESIVVECPDSDYNKIFQSYLLKASASTQDLEHEVKPRLASASKVFTCEERISFQKEPSSTEQLEELIFEDLSSKADLEPLNVSKDTKQKYILEEVIKENVSSFPNLRTEYIESKNNNQNDFETKCDGSFSEITRIILNVEKPVKIKSKDSISKESIVVEYPDSDYNKILQSYLLKTSTDTQDLEYEINPFLASTSKAFTYEERISFQKEPSSTKQQAELIFEDLSNKVNFDPLKVSKDEKQKYILEEIIKENVSSSMNLRTSNNKSKKNKQNDFEIKRDNDSFPEISRSILDAEKSVKIKSTDCISKESMLLANFVADSPDSDNKNVLQSYLLKASAHTQDLKCERNPSLESVSKAISCDESIKPQKELRSAKQQKEHPISENISNKADFDLLEVSKHEKQKDISEKKMKENMSSSPNLRTANNESRKDIQTDFEKNRDNNSFPEISGSALNVEKSVKIKSTDYISKELMFLENSVADSPDSDNKNVLQSYLLKASAHTQDLECEKNPSLESVSKAISCDESIKPQKELTSANQQEEHPISENLSNKADFDLLKVSKDEKQKDISEKKMKESLSSSPNLRTANNESRKDIQTDFERKRDNNSLAEISGSVLVGEKSVEIKSRDNISKESMLLENSVVDSPDSDNKNALQSYLLKASAHTQDLECEINPCLESVSKTFSCDESITPQKELRSANQQEEHPISENISNKADFDLLKVSKDEKQKYISEKKMKENLSSFPNIRTANNESRKDIQTDFERKRDNDSFPEISESVLDVEKSVEIKSIDSISKDLANLVEDIHASDYKNVPQSYLLKASASTQDTEYERNPCLESISKVFICDESISPQKELTSAKQQKEHLIFENLSNKADIDPLNVSKDTKRKNISEEKMKENLSSSSNLRTTNNESKTDIQKDFERKRDSDSFPEISGSILDVEKSVEKKSMDRTSEESILLANFVVDPPDSGNKNLLYLSKASAHNKDLEYERNPCLASIPKAFTCKESNSSQKELASTKEQDEQLIFVDWAFKEDCTVNVNANRDSVKFRTPRSSEITLDFKELYSNKDLVLDLLCKKIPVGNDEIILLENELTQNCLETSDLEFIMNELQRIEYYFQKPEVEKQQFLIDLRNKLKKFKQLRNWNSSEILQEDRYENKGCYYKDIRTEKSIYTLEITEYCLEIPVDLYIPIKLQELSKRSTEHIESYYSGEKNIRKVLILLRKLHEILNGSSDTKMDVLSKYNSYESKNLSEVTNGEDDRKIIKRYPDTFCCYILTALKLYVNPMFLLVCLSRALIAITFVPVITSVVDFSMDKGMAKSNGKYVIATLSAGDLIGRLCTGWITNKGYISDAKFMVLGLFFQAGFTAILPQMKSTILFLSVLTAFAAVQGALFVKHPVILIKYLREHEKLIGLEFMNLLSGFIGFITPFYLGYARDYLKAYDMLYYINGALSGAVGSLWLLEPWLRIFVPAIRD